MKLHWFPFRFRSELFSMQLEINRGQKLLGLSFYSSIYEIWKFHVTRGNKKYVVFLLSKEIVGEISVASYVLSSRRLVKTILKLSRSRLELHVVESRVYAPSVKQQVIFIKLYLKLYSDTWQVVTTLQLIFD